ncbi:hypothetical protein LCGC14_2038660 [marine sediment metagenome]|uniref:Uncharacterized protein n=1 Tax=marine sediment metagenome TaxID=412755 RepID=A0A0F9ESR0_9ZZZZ
MDNMDLVYELHDELTDSKGKLATALAALRSQGTVFRHQHEPPEEDCNIGWHIYLCTALHYWTHGNSVGAPCSDECAKARAALTQEGADGD